MGITGGNKENKRGRREGIKKGRFNIYKLFWVTPL